jgi:hypothetical protein
MRGRLRHSARRHQTAPPLAPQLRRWLFSQESAPVTHDRLLSLLADLRLHRVRWPGDDDFVTACAHRILIVYFLDQGDRAAAELLEAVVRRR